MPTRDTFTFDHLIRIQTFSSNFSSDTFSHRPTSSTFYFYQQGSSPQVKNMYPHYNTQMHQDQRRCGSNARQPAHFNAPAPFLPPQHWNRNDVPDAIQEVEIRTDPQPSTSNGVAQGGSFFYSPASIPMPSPHASATSLPPVPANPMQIWQRDSQEHNDQIVRRGLGSVPAMANTVGRNGREAVRGEEEEDLDQDLEAMDFEELKMECKRRRQENRELKKKNEILKASERTSCDLIFRARHLALAAEDEKEEMKRQLERSQMMHPNFYAPLPQQPPMPWFASHPEPQPSTSSASTLPSFQGPKINIKQELVDQNPHQPTLEVDTREVAFYQAVIGGNVVRSEQRVREIRPTQRFIPTTFDEAVKIWREKFSERILPECDLSKYLFDPFDVNRQTRQVRTNCVNSFHFYRTQMPKKEGNVSWDQLPDDGRAEWKRKWEAMRSRQKAEWDAGLIEFKPSVAGKRKMREE